MRSDSEKDRRGGDVTDVARRLAHVPAWAVFGVVCVTYLALAQQVMWLNDPVRHGAGFWPANGLTLAALLVLPRRRWPWVLAAVVVGELVGDTVLQGYPIAPSLWWSAANTVEPLVGALLIERVCGRPARVTMAALLAFLSRGVLLAPLVGATIGTIGTVSEFGGGWISTWVKFGVGDGLGILVVTPLLVLLVLPAPARGRRSEALALAAAVVTVTGMLFVRLGGQLEIVVPYVMIPLLIWAGMRFGARGAALAGFVMANGASAANGLGRGAFVLDVSDGHAITLLQVFVGISLTTGLIVAVLSQDISEHAETTRLLSHQAGHDHLTGLPNRKLLLARLRAALARSATSGRAVGVLFIDLDDFKRVNDDLGHAIGDHVLADVARRLDAASRPGDTIARFGGDEFVVVCPELDGSDDMAVIAERLLRVIGEPVHHAGHVIAVGASMGSAVGSGADTTADELLAASDDAMYRAKGRGDPAPEPHTT